MSNLILKRLNASTLHTAVGTAAGKRFHLSLAHQIEVAGNGVLQCRCSHCEFKRLGLGTHCEHSVTQPPGEGLATTHTVYDGVVNPVKTALFLITTLPYSKSKLSQEEVQETLVANSIATQSKALANL